MPSSAASKSAFNILRWFAEVVISQGDFSQYPRLVASHLIDHDVFPGEPPVTYEGLMQVVQDIRTAMPDVQFVCEDEAIVGDRHWARFTASGTMTGPLLGHAPTNKRAVWTEMHVARVDQDGRMVEHWGVGDELRRLVELGLIEL